MTNELVYANITSMMEDERRKQTEQKLIESGKAEFLKKAMRKLIYGIFVKQPGSRPEHFISHLRIKKHCWLQSLIP